MNKLEFTKIIAGIAANFGVKIPEGLIELWCGLFNEDNISLGQVRYAAGKILRSKKDGYGRMPTYAEFIEIIHGNKKDKALIIANEIIAYMRSNGSRVALKIKDETAKHLMSTRWPYQNWAATVREDDLKWWVKEFCEAYISYSALEMPGEIATPEEVKKLINLKAVG